MSDPKFILSAGGGWRERRISGGAVVLSPRSTHVACESLFHRRSFATSRLLMKCDLAFVTPSVSEGPGGTGGANTCLMPPTPPGPSLTLGVTAWPLAGSG